MTPSKITIKDILDFFEKNKIYAQKQLGMTSQEMEQEIQKLREGAKELC